MSNASRHNQARSLETLVAGADAVKSGTATPAEAYRAAVAPGLTAAYFTENELRTLANVCRDSDNENAGRILKAALARGGKS